MKKIETTEKEMNEMREHLKSTDCDIDMLVEHFNHAAYRTSLPGLVDVLHRMKENVGAALAQLAEKGAL